MTGPAPSPLHASLMAARRTGRWRGVLLEGPSGSGKSTLVLRGLASGWRLVADDRVLLWTSGTELFGRAPAALAGLIEVRSLGVVPAAALPLAAVALVVEAWSPDDLERVAEPARRPRLGVALPRVRLDLHDVAAVERVTRALDAALRGQL